MATPARTATLRLQLIDAVSGPAGGIASTLAKMDGSLKHLGKNASPAMKTLIDEFERLNRQAASAKGFREARRDMDSLSLAFKQARQNVNQLQAAFKASSDPTAKMKRELDAAKATLKETAVVFRQQASAVRESQNAMRGMGVEPSGLKRAQDAIRADIDKTIRKINELHAAESGNQPDRPRPPGEPVPPKRPRGRLAHRILDSTAVEMGGIYAGDKVARSAIDMVVEGARAEAARNRIRNVSNSPAEVDAAQRIASATAAQYPSTSISESLNDYTELRSLGASDQPGKAIDDDKMRKNVTLMARARAALKADGYDLTSEDGKALTQALEASGRINDPNGMEKMLDAYVRGKQTFGSAFSAQDFRTAVLNAKAANFSLDDPAFYRKMIARSAEGNPAQLGNEFSQTMSTLVGGHMTKQGAEWLADYGVISPDQIRKDGGGKFHIEGDVKDADVLSSDPTTWAQKTLMPAFEKAGIFSETKVNKRMDLLRKGSPGTDEGTLRKRAVEGIVADTLQKSGFRSTVTDQLIHAIANEALIERQNNMMDANSGMAAADTIGQNPIAAAEELMTSLGNLGSVLTSPVMRDAGEIMHGLAGGISELTSAMEQWQKDHPTSAKIAGVAVPAALVGVGGYMGIAGLRWLMPGIFGRGAAKAATLTAGEGGPIAAAESAGAATAGAEAAAAGGAAEAAGGAGSAGAAIPVLGVGAVIAMLAYFRHQEKTNKQFQQRNRDQELALKNRMPWLPDSLFNKDTLDAYNMQSRAEPPKIPYGSLARDPGAHGEALANRSTDDLQSQAEATGDQIKKTLSVTATPTLDFSSIIAQADAAAARIRAILSWGRDTFSSGPSAPVAPAAVIAPVTGATLGHRAGGGPVAADHSYIIGERGPEVLTMGGNGYVTPNHALGGGETTIHFHIHSTDPMGAAREIDRVLTKRLDRSRQISINGRPVTG